MPFKNQGDIVSTIKNVAVYARLSRGESESDLDRHLSVITEICEEHKWKYLVYPEIGSGESISGRIKFRELLDDIKDDIYDAVFVYDYDRLGRGSGTDQDVILKTFQDSDTLVITASPFSILNTNDERDEETIEFKGFIARREYKMIKKRLQAGKRLSLKMGRWATGYAPYGYKINPQLKKLEIDEENAKLFRELIVNKYLEGHSSEQIADILNERGIPSVRGNKWSARVVLYALKNKTYLGHIYHNRRYTDKDQKGEMKPESQWSVVENTHSPLITEDEYERITKEISSRSGSGEKGVNALGSMIKCFNCGKAMKIKVRKDVKSVGKCVECDNNRGGDIRIVEDAIYDSVRAQQEALENIPMQYSFNKEKEIVEADIERIEQSIIKTKSAIEKIDEAFETGMYSSEKAISRTTQRRQEMDGLNTLLRSQKRKLNELGDVSVEDKLNHINLFLQNIKKTDDNRKLKLLYKSIIEDVIWKRSEWNEIHVTVNFR